jgi:dTDP-D-glucose 4,6-dehydratase
LVDSSLLHYTQNWPRLFAFGRAGMVLFDEGMRQTAAWYRENQAWWRPLQERLAVAEGEWNQLSLI